MNALSSLIPPHQADCHYSSDEGKINTPNTHMFKKHDYGLAHTHMFKQHDYGLAHTHMFMQHDYGFSIAKKDQIPQKDRIHLRRFHIYWYLDSKSRHSCTHCTITCPHMTPPIHANIIHLVVHGLQLQNVKSVIHEYLLLIVCLTNVEFSP